jgi:outer membrane protein assembly factor BamA
MRAQLLFVVFLITAHSVLAQETTSNTLPPDWLPPAGTLPEPGILKKAINASDGLITDNEDRNDGLYAQVGQIATGAGWLTAGPGFHHQLFNGVANVDLSAAVSWRLYRSAQVRIEMPKLARGRLFLGGQVTYQDLLQVNYFGLGDQSNQSDRSAYRLNNFDVQGAAKVRLTNYLSLNGRIGWLPRPDISTATGRRVTIPSTVDRFSEDSAPGLKTQPSFLHGDVSLISDWRDHPGHPTRGGLYRATVARYSDRDSGAYSFGRLDLEASQFLPVFTRKLIVALQGWEVISSTPGERSVPFYLMPSLGGQDTLRGYYDYRFHDNNMQVFNGELRWSLFTHLDAAAFADAGKVSARAGDLDFHHLHSAYGLGFRMHNAATTVLRVDVGHSTEGWRVFFKLSDPFFKRRDANLGGPVVVPFVP